MESGMARGGRKNPYSRKIKPESRKYSVRQMSLRIEPIAGSSDLTTFLTTFEKTNRME
jgi:hypothetical protein